MLIESNMLIISHSLFSSGSPLSGWKLCCVVIKYLKTVLKHCTISNLTETHVLHTHRHTTVNLRPSWILSGTTRVRWHQKVKARKVKPTNLDLLEQEIVSDSGISWAIHKSAPWPRHITMRASHHSVFTGQMPFLPPNQQHQSTEGTMSSQSYFIR